MARPPPLGALPPPAPEPSLELLEVQRVLERVRTATGRASRAARASLPRDLFARATEAERRFLVGLLLREVRQGALEGVMVEAVARAAGVPSAEVRRALMLAGDLGAVAAAALAEGSRGLARFGLAVLRPLEPMLAASAEDLEDALRRARRPSSGTSTGRGSRSTGWPARSGSSRGTSRTPRPGCRRWWRRWRGCPSGPPSSTGRRSRSARTGSRGRSRRR